MPTSPLSASNLLDVLGARVSPSVGTDSKEGFQSLLELGSVVDGNADRKNLPLRRKDEPEDPVAAAVDAPAQPVVGEKPRVEIESPRRAERTDRPNDSDSLQADAANERARDAAQAQRDVNPSRKASEDKDVSTRSEGAAPVADADNDSDLPPVSANDNDASRDQLASALNEQIAFLSKLLEFLQAFGGSPQQALANNTTTLLQLTELKVTVSSFSITGGSLLMATDLSAEDAMKNIQDLLAQLQDTLEAGGDDANTNSMASLFSDLKKGVQDMLKALNQQTLAADNLTPETEALTKQVADLLSASKQLLAKLEAAPAIASEFAADTAVDLPEAFSFNKESAPVNKPKDELALQNAVPVVSSSTPTAVAGQQVVGAAMADGASGGNSSAFSNNQGGSQPMPQAIGATREANAGQNTGGVASTTFSRLLSQVQERPVIEQVAFHIKTAVSDGSSKIDIKLNPAELGRLEIRLHVAADGKTGVMVTADNKQTLDMLQRDSRGLEQALSDAGLKADSGSLSFNLRGGQQEQGQGSFASQTYQKTMPEEEQAPVVSVSGYYAIEPADGLDIRI